ncbi:hypothetical protein RhiirA1_487096, partial [Rhizophagus irregularis]
KASNGSRILIFISTFQLYLLNLTKIIILGIDSMHVSSLNSILTTSVWDISKIGLCNRSRSGMILE